MVIFIQKHRIILLHLAFWCLYASFFFYLVTFSRHGETIDYSRAFADASTQVTLLALMSYLNYFILLPRFLKHQNIIRYVCEFCVPFVLVNLLLVYIKRNIYFEVTSGDRIGFFFSQKFVIQSYLSSFFVVSFVSMLKFAEEWFALEAKKKEVENEKLMAELRFLKDQINPHFLFNTLNNLYYLAFTNSPNTTEVIAKLSQIMRYMIYDSNHAKVALVKEIEYMENYISLEKLRLNNEIPISFDVIGNPSNLQIVPFIFITFLENAFKHGVSNNEANSWVKIKLTLEGNSCSYVVENSKLAKNTTHEGRSGIGLKNVKRRLELSYPEVYNLEVTDTASSYCVALKLNL